ncbi:MAG: AAA family ATPase [Verrucomicrobia bacterium]|nr:AAA family ATPase [Verrucomicrobiota bacterium]
MSNLLETAEIHDVPDLAGECAPRLKPLNTWRPSQFLAWTEPPGSHFLLPAYLTRGELTTLIGQGGLGKSRLALWLAICQILARNWCGLETGGEPQKWLFLGDENSVARLKEDLRRMFSTLTTEEIARVDELLRLPALLDLDDCDVWLGDPTTGARIAATVAQEVPGVIVADPLANFAPGDIAKPGEMKEAIRLLLSIIRRVAPKAAVLLLHHARTGRQNIAQGIGWDAGNFGLGGKALFSAARCQLNLMPGKADDDTRLVLHCAKANNCQRFETRGLIFAPQSFTYTVDSDFDAAAWQAEVEGRARSGNSLCTVADVVAAVRDGYTSTKQLVAHLQDAYATSKRSAERLISRAVDAKAITQLTRGRYTLGRKAERLLEQATLK